MSRFVQECALVPTGARWTAALVTLSFAALMAGVFLVPVAVSEPRSLVFVLPVFLASLLGAAALGTFVLLVGYVFADAKRRGMNHVLWTLLALFIPNAIGIILYFILREPMPVPCPSCGAKAKKGHAFCAGCGTAVRVACPQCRQPVEPGWRNCARCGAVLAGRPEDASAATP
jgi:hypothetical protein